MSASGPRGIALQAMLQLVERGRSLDDIFASDWFRGLPDEPRDLAMSRELVYGLCRWYYQLQSILAGRLDKPLRDRDRDVELVLLLGLYQLLVMQTPAHAAVNETVRLVKRRRKAWASGLINAVLRGVIRDEVDLADDPASSYPEWMQRQLIDDWGECAAGLMAAGNHRAPMTLRVDTSSVSREEALAELARQEILASAHPLVDTALNLAAPCNVDSLPGFASGQLSVQDAAAQIAAPLLDCQPGMRVLDACAAPGGKTAHLLQHTDRLMLDAVEIDAKRLELIAENLKRIDRQARLLPGDAAEQYAWWDEQPYDRILVDAPCSASGVIRRHPDIKLLRRESDIIPLVERQRQILDSCWRMLKPGGQMLYSTCSIFKAENETQIEAFLQRHDDAGEMPLKGIDCGRTNKHGSQIMTGEQDMDGFYYALLRRQA